MDIAAKLDGITARLDEIGKPAWIGVMIAGFILFWPVGLGVLAYLIWSGRMAFWKHGGMHGMHHGHGRWHSPSCGGSRRRRHADSGNSAFDEYRAETLRRLEDEQQEFNSFLDDLRRAKDKAEFDQFMADRRRRSDDSAPQPQPEG
ncbi:DUF2852 domain-containing protein [Oleomonas cavernae]|uniref:DUF2852 domain-containing protein n=1 Tax=Oleomonas cavernae TaxID=2320859 RepID=A0A418WAC6_9PROT|nr:DUF2852 domain-containing protein [Oleomonas cavernae]RJF86987.1 DUF2852 domain-containing protein [Oleomonas cavernae]